MRPFAAPLFLFALLATASAQQPPPATPTAGTAATRPLRLGVVQWLRGNRDEEERIVPPVYSNHLPKALTYETLVTVDGMGRARPGLATHWEIAADGRRYVFHLRPNATFHDGSACDAAAVQRYFSSWLVRDVDRFVGLCERIRDLEVLGPHTLAIDLHEPYAMLTDLSLMNPMGIVGGTITPPDGYPRIGSGPWRVEQFEPMRRMLFVRHDGYDGPRPQLDRFEWITLIAGADRDPVSTWSLERGHVDAVVESWRPSIPRDLASELVAAGKARLVQGPGSMVQLLCFNHARGPFAERSWRRTVRDAVDRDALVRVVEHGFARPCTTLFAPAIADWPDAAAALDALADETAGRAAAAATTAPETMVMSTDLAQLVLAVELARQLRPHGIELRIGNVTPAEHDRRVKAGDYDLYITRTWGAPYDPQATLRARFCSETRQQRSVFFADPKLVPLIDAASRLEAGPARASIYTRIQQLLDERIAVIPLYVPDRVALLGPHVDGIVLGDVAYGIDLTNFRRRDGG